MISTRSQGHFIVVGALLAIGLGACDSTLPDESDALLVVEGFIDTDKPLPAIRLRRALSPAAAYDSTAAAVMDARIVLKIGTQSTSYAPVNGNGGLYRPTAGDLVPAAPGDSFALEVAWRGERISGRGIVPPAISIRSSDVRIPDEPVSAVLLDSLALSDSLSFDAQQGYIYPIEVALTWMDTEPSNTEYWIRAQLQPYATFSSSVVELFLRSEEIFDEKSARFAESGIRTWTGVYAVGVNRKDDPVPEHSLRIALIRSDGDYARAAASRTTPERSEPATNLEGAVGIFTAISVDSTRVRVGSPASSTSATSAR